MPPARAAGGHIHPHVAVCLFMGRRMGRGSVRVRRDLIRGGVTVSLQPRAAAEICARLVRNGLPRAAVAGLHRCSVSVRRAEDASAGPHSPIGMLRRAVDVGLGDRGLGALSRMEWLDLCSLRGGEDYGARASARDAVTRVLLF